MALTDKLTAIGDAIRENTGTTDLIPLADMPEKVDEVYKAGRGSFWDSFQLKGSRTDYASAFQGYNSYWDENNFYPKYDLVCVGDASKMFYAWENGKGTQNMDLKQRLEECGVVLDTSRATSLTSAFNYCKITVIPTIDMSSLTGDAAKQIFANSWGATHTIEKVIVNENVTPNNWFLNAEGLENITFEGVLGKTMNISSCTKLTHESIMSILNVLKDYSEDTSGTTYTLTLGTTNLAKLTDAEKAIATQKGWTLA